MDDTQGGLDDTIAPPRPIPVWAVGLFLVLALGGAWLATLPLGLSDRNP